MGLARLLLLDPAKKLWGTCIGVIEVKIEHACEMLSLSS
jgi:hypothetical protein